MYIHECVYLIICRVSFRNFFKGGGGAKGVKWTLINFGGWCNMQYHLIWGSGGPPPENFGFYVLGGCFWCNLRGILRHTGSCYCLFFYHNIYTYKCENSSPTPPPKKRNPVWKWPFDLLSHLCCLIAIFVFMQAWLVLHSGWNKAGICQVDMSHSVSLVMRIIVVITVLVLGMYRR